MLKIELFWYLTVSKHKTVLIQNWIVWNFYQTDLIRRWMSRKGWYTIKTTTTNQPTNHLSFFFSLSLPSVLSGFTFLSLSLFFLHFQFLSFFLFWHCTSILLSLFFPVLFAFTFYDDPTLVRWSVPLHRLPPYAFICLSISLNFSFLLSLYS